jgi:hypothetical protein
VQQIGLMQTGALLSYSPQALREEACNLVQYEVEHVHTLTKNYQDSDL